MHKKGTKNQKYKSEFKIEVIEKMRKEGLGYRETMRKFFSWMPDKNFGFIKQWERIYLEEGAAGLMEERRGRGSKESGVNKGRPPKLDKQVEEDLIAENQRLRMENEYLKKLQALALSRIKSENETKLE
jgi:transposase-like protein